MEIDGIKVYKATRHLHVDARTGELYQSRGGRNGCPYGDFPTIAFN